MTAPSNANTSGLVCYDKKGIPIERGDIVKVFHFIGARQKKNFMIKQCIGVARYPNGKREYVFFSHLNFREIGDRNGPYHMEHGAILRDYEIIQSIKHDHDERPRAALQQEG